MSSELLSPSAVPLPPSPYPTTRPVSPAHEAEDLIDLFSEDFDGPAVGTGQEQDLTSQSFDFTELRFMVGDMESARSSTPPLDSAEGDDVIEKHTEDKEMPRLRDPEEDAAVHPAVPAPRTSSAVDSLYEAIRSPSLERNEPPTEKFLFNNGAHDESSGELTRMMNRFPLSAPRPGAPYHHVRTYSHESFITNLQAASSMGAPRQSSSTRKGSRSTNRHLSDKRPPATEEAVYEKNEEEFARQPEPAVEQEWMTNPDIRLFGVGSASPHGPPQVKLPTLTRRPPSRPMPSFSPPRPSPSPPMSNSDPPIVLQLRSTIERNRQGMAELSHRLEMAREEAASLRGKFRNLRQLMISAGFDVDGVELPVSPLSLDPAPVAPSAVRPVQSTNAMDGHDQPRDDNGDDAREALQHILQALGLPPSTISSYHPPSPSLSHSRRQNDFSAPTSLVDITRAMDFLRSVDALVWKGRRDNPDHTRSRGLGSMFGEENVRALRERLELWERIVRNNR